MHIGAYPIRAFFQTMRLAETIAEAALLLASMLLVTAIFSPGIAALAQGLAVLGTAFFTCIWSGFIIAGNYFAYWCCHHWAQSNHFMEMYLGLFVLVILPS